MALSPAELKEIEERSSTTPPPIEKNQTDIYGGVSAYPEMEDVVKETAIGAAQGAAKAAPVLAGGMAGARIGLMVSPFAGPLAPVVPAIGLGTGLVAGYFGSQATDTLFPDVSRSDLAPYREGGKTFGESIAFAPVAFGLPVMTANRVSRFISGIGEAARKYPKTFVTSEALGATGAGLGGGYAVSEDPNDPEKRLLYEIGGGLLMPGRFATNLSGTAFGLIGNLKNQLSASGRQQAAANKLITELENAGEDIPAIIKALQANVPPGVRPTSGQKTGSVVLSAFEAKLAQGNAAFGSETVNMAKESMIAYQQLIEALRKSNNPAALTAAAELRQKYFTNLLDERLKQADAASAAAISKISKDTPAARVQIGEIVKDNTVRALRDARQYESTLWDKAIRDLTRREEKVIYQQVPITYNSKTDTWSYQSYPVTVVEARTITPVNTTNDFLKLMVNIPDVVAKRTLPPLVKDIMQSFGVTDDVVKQYKNARNSTAFMETGEIPFEIYKDMKLNKVDLADLLNYRTQLLDMAREASGKGELSNARFYGTLAEGLLQDLNRVQSPALDAARQFSKDLNDTFTRTFADELTAKNIQGGARIPAEILVQKAFGGSADLTAMRMKDIEDAAGFMRQKYMDLPDRRTAEAIEMRPFAKASEAYFGGVRDAQTQTLRLMAAKSVGPDGRLNVNQLQKFIADNQVALDRMGITPDLKDAVQAENLFRSVNSANSKLVKTAQNQSAFGQVLKAENPIDVVTTALNSKFPVKNFSNMAKMARTVGIDAVEGLRSTMMDYAYQKALNENTGLLDPQKFKQVLFDPIRTGQPSLVNIMRSQDIMSKSEVTNLRRITDAMDRIRLATTNRALMDELVANPSMLDDLITRYIGIRGAEMVQTQGPGSLMIAQMGSSAARNIFGKMPNMMVRGVLEEAAKDPELMAILLQRGASNADKMRMSRQLHSYLGAAGLNYASYEEPPLAAESPAPGPSSSSRMLRQMPPAPPTKGVPGLQTQPAGGPAPGGAPSQSRSMFQSLFPMDTISPLLNQPR